MGRYLVWLNRVEVDIGCGSQCGLRPNSFFVVIAHLVIVEVLRKNKLRSRVEKKEGERRDLR